MVRPLRHYADFRGRSGRREFWWYTLFLIAGYAAIAALAFPMAVTQMTPDTMGKWLFFGWIGFFAINLLPGLALTVRRFHDLGLSGVLTLIVYVVILVTAGLGWFAYLIVMSLPGQAKENRWGPPLGAGDVADVFA